MFRKLPDSLEYPLDKALGRDRLVEGNVIRNPVEILECGLGLDYASHRAMHTLCLRVEQAIFLDTEGVADVNSGPYESWRFFRNPQQPPS